MKKNPSEKKGSRRTQKKNGSQIDSNNLSQIILDGSTVSPFFNTLNNSMNREPRNSITFQSNTFSKLEKDQDKIEKGHDNKLKKDHKKIHKNRKCSNAELDKLMESVSCQFKFFLIYPIRFQKMNRSATVSKQLLYAAISDLYKDKNINVICSKHSFSYVVVTSSVFCEHKKRSLTCFVFLQSWTRCLYNLRFFAQ